MKTLVNNLRRSRYVRAIASSAVLALAACAAQVPATPGPWYPETTGEGDALRGVYQSRFPCLDQQARDNPKCERVKFGLALYHEPRTGTATRYLMARVYVGNDENRIMNSGSWSISAGTALDPQARVFQLDDGAPDDFRLFWAISDDVVFVLDPDRNPRVGDAGYGYAVNRTE